MWGARFWANRFWAARYWGKVGAEVEAAEPRDITISTPMYTGATFATPLYTGATVSTPI